MNDPISDCLIRIKNGYMARKGKVEMPYSKMKQAVLSVLNKHGYVGKIEIAGVGVKKSLIIDLLYQNKIPKLTDLEIVSKPGRRVYVPFRKLPKVLSGLGITIVSTPEGLLAGNTAHKKKIGGELICKVW